jgi:glycosyltransferase involved in cell wall biosynthesis
MKILHINHTDSGGGAARAVYRLHKSLNKMKIRSVMIVNKSNLKEKLIVGESTLLHRFLVKFRSKLVRLLVRMQITKNPINHSPSIFSSKLVKKINSSDADLVNLHWVQNESLSISDISKINKPLIWTLHDMWAFCGAEHLSWDNRWKYGYFKNNRPKHEFGFDINRWTWQRKKKYWKDPIQIIAPSNWIGAHVKNSSLMSSWPMEVIHNPINTDFWKPSNKMLSRKILGLPKHSLLLLFGAVYGDKDHHKGFDLLLDALGKLKSNPITKKLELVFFGKYNHKNYEKINFPIHNMGYIKNDKILRALYNAANGVIIPSRQDNLPNNGLEAHACGVPIIAFNTGGLADIIEHNKTGYLAKTFDTKDLAKGISWVLNKKNKILLGRNARERAIEKFSQQVVIKQYQSIYEKVLNKKLKNEI